MRKPADFLDDKVAKAVDAVEAKEQLVQVDMQQVQVKLLGRDDRPAAIAVPRDITDLEIINLMVNIAVLGDQLRALRPSSRIIVPNGASQ